MAKENLTPVDQKHIIVLSAAFITPKDGSKKPFWIVEYLKYQKKKFGNKIQENWKSTKAFLTASEIASDNITAGVYMPLYGTYWKGDEEVIQLNDVQERISDLPF